MSSPSSIHVPEVSVVIVSYRCRDLLIDCLNSLEAQRTDVDLEVLVIDNASGDDTCSAIRGRFPRVDVEESAVNLGFARANNRAIRRSRGRAILVLNPDTVIPSGGLRACLDELWSVAHNGVLTPRLLDPEGHLDRRCKRGFPTIWSSFCYFTGLDHRLTNDRSTRYTMGSLPETSEGEVEAVSGAFMLMPRAVLDEVGLFDESYFMFAEDIDLCLRIRDHGYRVWYWPEIDVIHVGGGSNVAGKRPPEANVAYFRTMGPFYRKHRPGLSGRVTAFIITAVAECMLFASKLGLRRLSPHTKPVENDGG